MAYSNNDDLFICISSSELARITGGSEIDYDKVNQARNSGDSIIEAYLFGRIKLDLDNIPMIINKISIDLTIVNLFENYYSFSDIPNTIQRKKRDSINLLKEIALSKINIFPQNSNKILVQTNKV